MTPYQRGYSAILIKLAVSSQLAKKVLLGKGLGMTLDDVLSAGTYDAATSKKRILDFLKRYPRTIRKAGPEAQRMIYGPPQIEAPQRWANMAWNPDATTMGKLHVQRLLGLRA